MEITGEPVQLIGRSNGVDLNAAVIKVAHRPGEPQGVGMGFDEPAKANTLHAPRNEPLPGFAFSPAQWRTPEAQSGWPISNRPEQTASG
jgi:hypothetical protein